MKYTMRIDSKFMETFGSSTLTGAIAFKYPDVVWSDIKELTLEFVQTSTDWRRRHDGPNTWLMPEYSPMCFAENLLRLQAQGIKVIIETITEDPK